MSWVKKVWNRMFTDEIEEVIEPEYEAPIEHQKSSAPFRFPVITDAEREIFLQREQSGEKVTMAQVREELMQRPLRPSQMELERRENRPAPAPLKREPQPPAVQRTPRTAKPKLESRTEPIKRRFEPTRIPSPIHGFSDRKPEPIGKLLEQKDLKEEFHKAIQPQPVQKKPVIEIIPEKTDKLGGNEKLPAVQETVSEEILAPFSNQFKAEEISSKETAAEPDIKEEAEVLETIKTEVEMPEKTQDAAFMEEKAMPLDFADKNLVHTDKPQETPVAETETGISAGKKKEKTVPFNVLMLKSDKEKFEKMKALAPKPLIKAAPVEKPAAIAEPKPSAEEVRIPEVAETPMEAIAQETPLAVHYEHPDSSFLRMPENDRKDDEWMEEQGERLIEALSHFQVQATILSIVQGPAVTQFELTVAQGVKVSKIRNLADDLKLALAAKDIRIQAPIPGKSSIGIEIPNRTSRAVRISEVIGSPQFKDSDSPLEAALGLDLTGKPVTLDLRKMPHGLIAGATGSGKSVCINSILVSLLYKSSPRDLKLLLIDPKMVELAPYNHISHLVSPVITDVKAATASLKWAVSEMERRYQLFAHTGVRDISRYNKMVKEKGDYAQHLPYILIVIDELADLMMMSPSDVEDAICRIAQKARACGIHLVIATQRPSVDVITGLIKSNIPTRIAFSVSSQVDSRTILDSQGAERLLGRGDMLYLGNGMSAPSRIQGTFVTDEEIEQIIDHVRSQGEPEYFFKEEELIKHGESGAEQDELFEEACRFIMQQGSASTSLLQRKFHIGYNRAARLMDLIEQHGFISEQNGSKARSVLITEEDMSEVFQ